MKHNNLNLIRKLAWSFHYTTGIDYDDLFSEASLGYSEALNNHDTKKTANLCTFAYRYMTRRLTDFCRKENTIKKHYAFSLDMFEFNTDDAIAPTNPTFNDLLKNTTKDVEKAYINSLDGLYSNFSRDCKVVVFLILKNFDEYDSLKPKQARGMVSKQLREIGWGQARILVTIREMKGVLGQF